MEKNNTESKSLYIVFEGIVGTGKTTQSKKLRRYLRQKYPNQKVIWTREPGGDPITDAIRQVVQGVTFDEEMEPLCEAYLYAASRAQTLRTIVKPVLNSEGIVVADRSFITSLAYQGGARGLGLNKIWEINKAAVGNLLPDIIFHLNLDLEAALKRTFDAHGDKFENFDSDFFKRTVSAYKKASKLNFLKDRWLNIDANGTKDQVFERILQEIN